jgi:hypothetical protein
MMHIDAEIDRAETRLLALLDPDRDSPEAGGPEAGGRPGRRPVAALDSYATFREQSVRQVAAAVSAIAAGVEAVDDETAADVLVALTDVHVRDEAARHCESRDSGERTAAAALWRDLSRRAPLDYLAPPATLYAYACWHADDGPAARRAVDRALLADRGYRLAVLLKAAVDGGLPPVAMNRLADERDRPRPRGRPRPRRRAVCDER